MTGRYSVAPVAKAMQVLLCIGRSVEPLPLKVISSHVGLPKTTVFRYLRTLRECGVVSHDPERDLYAIDVRMLSLIQVGAGLRRLREVSLPHMQALAERFGVTVNLGVLDGADVVYLEILQDPGQRPTQSRVGGRDPSHATALGKAILAFLPEPLRQDVIPPRLRKITTQTLSNASRLQAELEQAAAKGYALEFGESEDGAACVGVPVVDPTGKTPAGLSITAPSPRMTEAMVRQLAPAMQEAARRIGVTLALG